MDFECKVVRGWDTPSLEGAPNAQVNWQRRAQHVDVQLNAQLGSMCALALRVASFGPQNAVH